MGKQISVLIYSVSHPDGVDYEKAALLEGQTPEFKWRVTDCEVRFDFNVPHPSLDNAREAVAEFIRCWEFSASIDRQPGIFCLKFKQAESTENGRTIVLKYSSARGYPPTVKAGQGSYPAPNVAIALNNDIEVLFSRYSRFCEGKETLGAMANFCLSILRQSAKHDGGISQKYGVSGKIESKLGALAANKGGRQHARKAKGVSSEYTPSERKWIIDAIRMPIRRAAEVEFDPCAAASMITLEDLPQS